MRSARLTPRQYQGLPLTPRDADLPFHATGGNFLARPKLPLHELSPRLQPPSPRRTPRPQSALHSPRFAASHPSITKAASRYRPASARPAAATAVSPPRDRSPPPPPRPPLNFRGFAVEVEPLSPRSRPASAFVGSPREHSSRRVGSAPTARAQLPQTAAPAAVEASAPAPAEPSASAPSAAEDAAADATAVPAAELEPLALLRAVDLLRGEDEATLLQLLQLGSLRRYRRYAVVSREGGDVDGLALLLAGSLLRTTQVGSPYGASELRAGDAVDLEALVDGCGALRRDGTYQAAEDAVVLVVGKKALSGLALGAARRAAQRRLVRALLKPLKAFRTLQSSALDALSAYFSLCFHDEGGVVYRAGEPADRLFLVAEGSVAVLPADAVPADDDDGGGGSPRRWSLTSAESGHGRRFSLRRYARRATEVVAADGAETPWLGGTAALQSASGTARPRATGAVALRPSKLLSLAAADADAVFQIAPQLLAEWQEQTKRAAGVRQLLSVAAAPAAATEASNPERVARWGRMVAKLLARRERLATAPARPTVSLRVEDYF